MLLSRECSAQKEDGKDPLVFDFSEYITGNKVLRDPFPDNGQPDDETAYLTPKQKQSILKEA